MPPFKYDHDAMLRWYAENIRDDDYFDSDRDLAYQYIGTSHKYERLSDKQVKKRKVQALTEKSDGYLAAFVKHHVKHIAKFRFIAENTERYPNGLYCVLAGAQMMAVFPRMRLNDVGHAVLAANHLTFCLNRELDEVQLHLTTYVPNALDKNVGSVSHHPRCPFKNGVQLPSRGYACDVFDALSIYADDLLDIARVYATAGAAVGGSGRGRGVEKVRRQRTTAAAAPDAISPMLEQLLLRRGIKGVHLFRYRHDGQWHANACMEWVDPEAGGHHVSFACRSSSFQSAQKELIKQLRREQ